MYLGESRVIVIRDVGVTRTRLTSALSSLASRPSSPAMLGLGRRGKPRRCRPGPGTARLPRPQCSGSPSLGSPSLLRRRRMRSPLGSTNRGSLFASKAPCSGTVVAAGPGSSPQKGRETCDEVGC